MEKHINYFGERHELKIIPNKTQKYIPCFGCGGKGYVINPYNHDTRGYDDCPDCLGKGEVEEAES